MMLVLTVLGLAAVGVGLAGAVAVRALARADHRCVERALPSCARCGAAARGEDRGGHLVCACGAVSPHLFGSDLLAWRAEHHSETLPPLPAGVEPVIDAWAEAAGEGRGAVGDDADVLDDADDEESLRRTTRVRAAAEEEERVRQVLAEELHETQRRMVQKARRRPDPITPQLLREAEQLGVRPEPAAPNAPAAPDADETVRAARAAEVTRGTPDPDPTLPP